MKNVLTMIGFAMFALSAGFGYFHDWMGLGVSVIFANFFCYMGYKTK